ncbi:MAG: hypothetical protein KGQ36_06025 [Rickettsiales bacterium]|nr:hypothetical protein [Rickettsiales bacterium]
MKKYLLICTIFLFSSCSLLTIEDQNQEPELTVKGFVNGSEDIPLVKGLTQTNDENLGFDSSSGSISSTTYKSEIDLERIKNFYVKTLPQMGWKLIKNKIGQITLVRDKEKLEIGFVNENGDDLVKFLITSTL